MPETNEARQGTCEYMLSWSSEAGMTFCGAPAVLRYPAAVGGYMRLCAEHGEKHAAYSQRLVNGVWITPAAPGARGA